MPVPQGHAKRRRSGRALRIIGNLLIATGLLMLVGLGGWYGYTQWSNERFKEELIQEFGEDAFEPPVQAEAKPTPTTPPPPLPDLSSPLGIKVVQAMQTPVTTDASPPVRLEIPSVKIDSPVVPVTWRMIPSKNGEKRSEWEVADYAVGHHYGSANPGQPGNVVLSGHVDYKGEVFRNLDKVNKGDEVTVYTEKGQYMYVVTDLVLVREEGVSEEQKWRNAMYMNPTPDLTLTMITCWPYGIDTHRLIVIAKPYQSAFNAQAEFSLR